MVQGDIRQLRPEDIEQAFSLEKEGYPENEAASYNMLVYRQREAPQLFLGYFEGHTLIGYVCGTRYSGPNFKEESMHKHEPEGDAVCIHSVCVHQKHRCQGIALWLLSAYIRHVQTTQEGVKSILLLTHSSLIPLYTKANFVFVQRSEIKHGALRWYEMEYKLSLGAQD